MQVSGIKISFIKSVVFITKSSLTWLLPLDGGIIFFVGSAEKMLNQVIEQNLPEIELNLSGPKKELKIRTEFL